VCVVEIPDGARNKFECDPQLGGIKFDRLLMSAATYPADYGHLRGTLGLDGDPGLLREQIEQFFSIYKDLEGKEVEIDGWHSRDEARLEIAASRDRDRKSSAESAAESAAA
jgi:inorganic pyrophosphatase